MLTTTGVFARENIEPGSFVGIYSGELITLREADKRDMWALSTPADAY